MKEQKLPHKRIIFVCRGDACREGKSKKLMKRIKKEIKARDANDRVCCVSTGCLRLCGEGANAVVVPDGHWYTGVRPKDAAALLDA
jgi:NADH:ubiquinone oxidoreductase subunit E